jgi:hypothetical protein
MGSETVKFPQKYQTAQLAIRYIACYHLLFLC